MDKILLAFAHVQTFFPSVAIVIYDKNGQWLYMDENFESFNFIGCDIDVSILEDASDSIETLPFIYQK